MAKLPDWLMNEVYSDPNLIEDSPQFRQKEQATQKSNLVRAANSALDVVRDRTRQSQIETMNTQLNMIQQMRPMPVPLEGAASEFFPTDQPATPSALTPATPTAADFNSEPVMPEPTQPSMPEMPSEENQAAEVMRISQETGIPAQQVAAMVLLGQDIARVEKQGQAQPVAPEPPAPNSLPNPLMGPPPTIAPSGTLPSPMPQQ